MEEENPMADILDLVEQAKAIAEQYYWDPIDAHHMYDEISDLKNKILSNQTNYIDSEDIVVLEG